MIISKLKYFSKIALISILEFRYKSFFYIKNINEIYYTNDHEVISNEIYCTKDHERVSVCGFKVSQNRVLAFF